MLKFFERQKMYKESLFLGALSAICLSLSIFRFLYTDSTMYLFLIWNLFLACIPWFLTRLLMAKPKLQKRKLIIISVIGVWILFFPNAPYILTDLFHLRLRSSMPIWYDLVLVLSFAWTGLLFGFLSLWDIEKIIGNAFNNSVKTFLSICMLFLGSFGIYVGRYLRWNSWDLLTDPFRIIYDIGHRVIFPFQHPTTWGMTMALGLFLTILYLSFKYIQERDVKSVI
ncbi:MAG: DUF1361 domain-containing protein [Bacteroidetes bacterium]|nr:DUF1361 domain-containing protein [Bacteroidota bacterium]